MARNFGPESAELCFLPSASAMRDPSGREVIMGIRYVLIPKSPEIKTKVTVVKSASCLH